MSDPICVVCERRPTPDGNACPGCAHRTDGKLAVIIDLTPDARLVAAGLVRRGGGSGSNKPGSRPPLNDSATDVMDEVQNTLTTLARDVAETRGLQIVSAHRDGRSAPDPLIAAAKFLSGQVEWLRHAFDGPEPYAVRAYDEIAVCAGRIRGLVNGRSEQRFLGPCGAKVTWDDEGAEVERESPCEGDVFAYIDAKEGGCRECGARWATAERKDRLDGKVREYAFLASELADAYGINVKTIRTWANRGVLKTYWRTEGGIVADWAEPPEGETRERLHYVGDVLDLAAADAARREGERAKRARRAAVKAAETDERMTA